LILENIVSTVEQDPNCEKKIVAYFDVPQLLLDCLKQCNNFINEKENYLAQHRSHKDRFVIAGNILWIFYNTSIVRFYAQYANKASTMWIDGKYVGRLWYVDFGDGTSSDMTRKMCPLENISVERMDRRQVLEWY